MAENYCVVDGCDRPAEFGELCMAHRKRKVRGQTVAGDIHETGLSGFEQVLEAIKAIGAPEYDGDEGEHAWRARMRAASWAWLDPDGRLRQHARMRQSMRRRRASRGPHRDHGRKRVP